MKYKIFTLAVLFIFSILSLSSIAQTGVGISDKGTLNSYPYILKRLVDDSFDYFQMGKNNWQYTNHPATMWPQEWWQQFNYSLPPYPIYPYAWGWKPSYTFPDWPLFVETFGELYCYLNSPLYQRRIFNPVAEKFWFLKSNKWPGSCYGLAASSILAFSSEVELKQRFPALGNFDNLYSVIMNNNVRKVINLLWTVQWNELSQVNIDQNRYKTPLQTLEDLKSVLYYPNQENVILCFYNQAPKKSGAHAVLPYLIREGSNIDTIEIYDSNDPIPKRILINKQDTTWDYYIGNVQWGGSEGLFLSESLTGYLDFIPPPKTFTLESNPIISIYSDTDDAILITNMNQANEYIQYDPLDTTIINTFSFGRPIINFTGSNSPPVGYRLYDGEYKIELSSKFDSSSSISVMRDNILISYSRNDFDSSETDLIKVKGDSLIVQNIDLVNKVIDIQYIFEENNDFKTYAISNLVINPNDSLTSEINSSHEFILSNPGQIKNYDLRIVFQNSEKEDMFLSQQVELNLNSSHQILPQWDSLTTSSVIILVDIGNNGTIDDSLHLQNQLFNFQINDAWNLLSLPVFAQDSSVASLFPFAITKAFSYQTSSYTQNDFVSPGIGYWLKFGQIHNAEVIGEPVLLDTIAVRQGWNLIGTIRKPISVMNIISIPPDIINSPFYRYEGSYQQSEILEPSRGYWVKCNEPGALILSSEYSSLKKPSQSDLSFMSTLASLQFGDITGASQKLIITTMPIENIDYFELPPLPPAGIFDARFSTGRMLEAVEQGEQKEIPIIISHAQYPLTINWDMKDEKLSAFIRIGNEGYSLSGSGFVTITDHYAKIALLLGSLEESSPEQFALEQNYPNPFNSNTIIKFSIADEVQVNLSIYNVLGEKVSELKNEIMKPGGYDVEFNSSKLATGVYLYKLKAGEFTQTMKMVILK